MCVCVCVCACACVRACMCVCVCVCVCVSRYTILIILDIYQIHRTSGLNLGVILSDNTLIKKRVSLCDGWYGSQQKIHKESSPKDLVVVHPFGCGSGLPDFP
eukprot:TRINITY_DN30_c0_g1_i12.p1 TRINITY_DN30_c0_g1~~TRINITY_DN30_c0_g1_i12.p1  ORF type:complete len:102 (-),score=18.43 TRINITY_DN30_c0_g1_i12:163-468(-)